MSNKEIHRHTLLITSCLVSVFVSLILFSHFFAVSLALKFFLSRSLVYTPLKIQTLGIYCLRYGEYILKRSNTKHETVYGMFFRKLGTYLRNKLDIAEIMRMRNFLLLITSELKLNKFVRMLIGQF